MTVRGFRSMALLIALELAAVALLWRCCSSTADAQDYGAKVASEEIDDGKASELESHRTGRRVHRARRSGTADQGRRRDLGDGADQLTLAQAAVSECGWTNKRCHAAVWWFLRARSRMRRRTITQTTHDYCATWDASNDDNERARWVRDLPAVEVSDGMGLDFGSDDAGHGGGGVCRSGGDIRPRCTFEPARANHSPGALRDSGRNDHSDGRPSGWPDNASWPRHLRLWRAVYARAGAFLRGRVANPCNRVPVHTGATYGVDLERAKRAQWVALECGDTGRQAFYGRGGR